MQLYSIDVMSMDNIEPKNVYVNGGEKEVYDVESKMSPIEQYIWSPTEENLKKMKTVYMGNDERLAKDIVDVLEKYVPEEDIPTVMEDIVLKTKLYMHPNADPTKLNRLIELIYRERMKRQAKKLMKQIKKKDLKESFKDKLKNRLKMGTYMTKDMLKQETRKVLVNNMALAMLVLTGGLIPATIVNRVLL